VAQPATKGRLNLSTGCFLFHYQHDVFQMSSWCSSHVCIYAYVLRRSEAPILAQSRQLLAIRSDSLPLSAQQTRFTSQAAH
jgi:hypothetical protein